MKDKIYSRPLKKIQEFKFDAQVANVFRDMIGRSVPGYADIVAMCGVLAAHYVRSGKNVYDLGCSLGTASEAVLAAVPSKVYRLIAVDSSEAMVKQAGEYLKASNVTMQCAKLEDVKIEKAAFVMLNFVLQFIPKKNRLAILKKIYGGMIKGGALILSEKVNFENKQEAEAQRKLHEEFKRLQGYSKLEISQKRTALEKVLIPETLKAHMQRLKQAGFKKIYIWFRCFNFASLVAVK